MKLKKFNAIVAILATITLVIHIGYNIFAYLTFYYNPMLKYLTAIPFMVLACIHAVCGMCVVFLQGDGTRLDIYQKQNRVTIIQRISAAMIFPLLILHLQTFGLLKSMSEKGQWFVFALLIILQILFFLTVAVHIAVSFSKAFITLGVLQDRKKQQLMDKIVYVLSALLFIFATIIVVRTQLMMFLPK